MDKRPTVVTQAREHVLAYIRTHRIEPGDRLPAMGELAAQCAISVPAMREALQGLRANGIVEFRHGTGVFLRREADQLILPNPPASQLQGPVLVELLEARRLIEPRLAELATERAAAADVEQIHDALRLSAEAASDPGSDQGTAAVNFHRAIARRSGHSVLGQFIDSLLEIYATEQHMIAYLHGSRAQDHAQHVEIFEALQRRSGSAARRAMEDHLTEVTRTIREKLEREHLKLPSE